MSETTQDSPPTKIHEKHLSSIAESVDRSSDRTEEGGKKLFQEGRRLPKWIVWLLAISLVCGIFCIVLGSLVRTCFFEPVAQLHVGYDPNCNMFLHLPPFGLEAVKLAFNLIFVKPCLFVFFQVHGNATKWKIALETSPETEPYPKGDKNYYENTRLEFNANPRFLVSSRDSKFGPTGLPANVIMAIALAITYAASQMVLLELEDNDDQGEPASNAVLPHFAFHVLGVVILIQAFLSIWALVACRGDIKTWNASPFATAYILSQELGRVRRIPGRFMQSLYHRYRDSQSVVQPTSTSTKSIWRKLGRCRLESLYHYIRGSQHEMKSEVVQIVQMSAWDSHPIFRSLTMWVWMLIGSGFFWGILIYFMVQSGTPGTFRGTSWVPVSEPSNSTSTSGSSVLNLGWDGVAPISGLVWGLAILVGFQGGIVTTAMTCAQTILDLACDQRLWMEIRGKGSDPNPHMFRKLMICWHSWVLHIADPLFHWLFGLAVNISADKGLQVKPVPVFWVSAVGVLGAFYITIHLKIKIMTSLPATFGHLQTMVDLVDKWDERMYWGDKSIDDESVRHAGTSNQKDKVKDIKSSESYGGKDCKLCHGRVVI